ncbi:hypothetical protein FA95DRAFT_123640 [Auriscalpium vulgare]|uniref:Uncharacterized protein n=1 Tax=Auriscalpium vulgare TaxID=40419 RepID=A0ACB8RPM6_9AGAM|nr:hypothetical protein FA95DRAFT_123640 [Auriscalpium vulgare]
MDAFPARPSFARMSGQASLMNRVIKIWSGVRALELPMVWMIDSEDPPVQLPRTLQALSISALDIPSCWPAAGTVPPALHDLEVQCRREVDVELERWTSAAVITSGVLAQLRTLRIIGPSARLLPTAAVEQLAVLETLVIDNLPTIDNFALPRSLQHLGYHADGKVSEEHWQVQILLDAARSTLELRLLTATRYSSQTVLKQLEDACRARGAEFGVYAEPACFPSVRSVDWI